MATLITGGNGWVPSHIVRRLAQRDETVVSYDLMPVDDLLRDLLGDSIENVVFAFGDVTDAEGMLAIAREYGVTRIIHAAAITPRRHRELAEPKRIVEVNLIGTINALDAARQLDGFERFVYVSSCAATGDHPELTETDEDTVSTATGLYGITKHTSERICQRYAELYGLDIVAMRPANVYGPMERDTPGYQGGTEPREMLRIYFQGNPVLIDSLEGPYLDWTYVEDIAEGIERAWSTPNLPEPVYSVTCGKLYSIGDVLEQFQTHMPSFEYRVVPEDEANYHVSGEPPGPVPSNARMRRDLSWVPSTPFEDGMQQYLSWIQENGPQ
ncbi:MAG TPA: NAD(P)-dependent oxidoreductase [Thermomicrobiales bacterium]|nr:NAD(P)-dependent oxidoreductase [Thermomicrobiales bacterium]